MVSQRVITYSDYKSPQMFQIIHTFTHNYMYWYYFLIVFICLLIPTCMNKYNYIYCYINIE